MATCTLFPVLMHVPFKYQLKGKRTPAEYQSQIAREALEHSLDLSHLTVNDPLVFDLRGAPEPNNGVLFSLTHKTKWVGAVCAPQADSKYGIGIDIEEIKDRKDRTYDYVADDKEWGRLKEKNLRNFYRLWTAKEAVLKAIGTGLQELGECKLVSATESDEDHGRMTLTCKDLHWRVMQYFFEDHLASVTCLGNDVKWITVS